jgi:hypothetical protein
LRDIRGTAGGAKGLDPWLDGAGYASSSATIAVGAALIALLILALVFMVSAWNRTTAQISIHGWIALTLGVVLSIMSASAQEARINFGLLTCASAKGEQQKVALKGPTQAVTCAFKPTAAGTEENYGGTIHRSGAGKEVLTKFVLIWVVSAPANTKATRGWLEQGYVAERGASDPTVRLFVGQTNRSIVLQMETNADVPGGQRISVSRVDLKLAAIPAGTAFQR